jgi:CMP-N-acetylneuraminic acid synthetase
MYKNIKLVAIIPARKGSKGVRNKNIRKLDGISLIEHTIRDAINTEIFDKIIVSSDSKKIQHITQKYKIVEFSERPPHLATDTSKIYDLIKYEISNQYLYENKFYIIVLLQPTSPLRSSSLLKNSVITYIDHDYTSLASVCIVDENPILMRSINEGKLEKIINSN